MNPIFQDLETFKESYIQGLESMLDAQDLGAFILVLANAKMNPAIWHRLESKLLLTFEQLKLNTPHGSNDDELVFDKLKDIDIETLALTEYRQSGFFEVQYNPLRALRPKRLSQSKTKGMYKDFDNNGFHFNKDFLKNEVFWQGQFFSKEVTLFYNKFPFADWHGLVVVEPTKKHPQLMTQDLHHFAWMMANSVGIHINGWTLAYNAYGAYASVNHFHLQCFIREKPLPIETQEKYPLVHQSFSSVSDAWMLIESLHEQEQPYHVIYKKDTILVIIRKRQGEYQHASWSSGYAWYEACGGVCIDDLSTFKQLDALVLNEEINQLALK